MVKIMLYMGMTVNGYIAKEDDSAPWSKEIWKSYYKIAKKYEALILGRRTYEIMDSANEFEKIGNPFVVVITSKNMKNTNSINFVESPKEASDLLNTKRFKKALLGGGAKVNSSFIKEGLVDEICLDIEPAIFGKGLNLFFPKDFEVKLKLLKINKLSQNSIQLHYKVIR